MFLFEILTTFLKTLSCSAHNNQLERLQSISCHNKMVTFQNFSLLLTVLFLLGPVTCKNRCTDKCGHVHIQFPFYLENSNLNHTTYPHGFDLLCTDKHETVLNLPSVPVKFYVKHIDYQSQQIQVYDPNNCLPSQLLTLGNSSISPYHFESDFKNNVSFFHCSSRSSSCPVLQIGSDSSFTDPEILSCTKVSAVSSVEWDIMYDDPNSLILGWLRPDCRSCEAQGKKCKLKNNGTRGETECFIFKTNKIPTTTIVLIASGM